MQEGAVQGPPRCLHSAWGRPFVLASPTATYPAFLLLRGDDETPPAAGPHTQTSLDGGAQFGPSACSSHTSSVNGVRVQPPLTCVRVCPRVSPKISPSVALQSSPTTLLLRSTGFHLPPALSQTRLLKITHGTTRCRLQPAFGLPAGTLGCATSHVWLCHLTSVSVQSSVAQLHHNVLTVNVFRTQRVVTALAPTKVRLLPSLIPS